MTPILLNLAVTLDGFIEGPNGEFDWCLTDQDYGMTAFLNRCSAIILGRKSYETLLSLDPNPFPDKVKYVFSNTLQPVADNTVGVKGDPIKAVEEIKQQCSGAIWFFGGAALLQDFLKLDLIDEMHLAVHPLLLGSGKRLFPDGMQHRKHFQLKAVESYSSGMVQLIYQR